MDSDLIVRVGLHCKCECCGSRFTVDEEKEINITLLGNDLVEECPNCGNLNLDTSDV